MFDMGFLELLMIGIIALIVLGPERLPKAARSVGLWVGKAKQGFNSIKQEIDRELKVQELQQQLEKQKSELLDQNPLESINSVVSEAQNTIDDISEGLKPHSLNEQNLNPPEKAATITNDDLKKPEAND